MVLYPNKLNLFFSFISLIIFLSLLILILSDPPYNYFVGLLFLFYFSLTSLRLAGFWKVKINEELNEVHFFGLFSNKAVQIEDIISFKSTVHNNAFKTWSGVLITLKNKKTIHLAGQNIFNIEILQQYLKEKMIPYNGETSMPFPYT